MDNNFAENRTIRNEIAGVLPNTHAQTFSMIFLKPLFQAFSVEYFVGKKRNFQASGIFHVLPKKNLVFSENKYIVNLNPPKPLSFVGELQRSCIYKK